ncbi:polysaccharide biosynthesis protein [Mediterraneibacter glycyrrhizinilyticus]|nr:polysaccharide biosynthesis protein [Mediterraneibacter glycyrrhizinilyticus]MBM6853236.1 polysaccharide biosynthesis protein [Mediterraneibacter glycyrrhizinilyticus]
MKIQRTKNAIRNVFWGILFRIVATLCPFAMRTVLLYILGVEYLGLNSLFTSLLSFLSLAELGIGNAMVYAMYKPVAQDDDEAICALLKLYKKLYQIIGLIILTIGLILLPFVEYLVNGSYPPGINPYLLYLIYLFHTVISYFMFGYKQSILMAFHRNDLINKRATILRLLMYGAQALILFLFKNYYLYIIILPMYTIATNIANSIIVDKLYPQYKCRGSVPKEISAKIKRNVLSLVGNKLSDIVLNSSDNLILSIFIGLSMVAMYDNYYYVFNAVVGFALIMYNSLTAGLGNSIELETMEKNYHDFKVLTFLNSWFITWCSACLICLMQPFMRIWVGKELMFSNSVVILFGIYFYIFQSEKIVLTYKDAAGLWWQDRFRPYVVMGTNLLLNIITVQIIGVYGVILSTIVSLLISLPWSGYILHKHLFCVPFGKYVVSYFRYLVIAIITCVITYMGCSLFGGGKYMQLILRFVICCILPNIIFLLLNIKNPELKDSISKVKGIAGKFIKKRGGEGI